MTGQMKDKQKLTELVIKAQAGDQNALNDLIGACFTKAVISYGTTDISDWFSECETLTTVNIPDTVTKMEGTFFNCTSLRDIYFQGSMAAWEATYKDETEYDPITGEITQYAWDYGTGDYVVHCTDGDIYKNAT
jgi:hypothetical protein